jgi:hypothetical protein
VKFRVLESLKVKTPEGERELQPGEIITLPRDKAIELINQGRIAPIGRVAYKVYSEILKTHLWAVAEGADRKALGACEDVREPIYTGDEIGKLRGMPEEALRGVHEGKTVFPGSTILESRRYKKCED